MGRVGGGNMAPAASAAQLGSIVVYFQWCRSCRQKVRQAGRLPAGRQPAAGVRWTRQLLSGTGIGRMEAARAGKTSRGVRRKLECVDWRRPGTGGQQGKAGHMHGGHGSQGDKLGCQCWLLMISQKESGSEERDRTWYRASWGTAAKVAPAGTGSSGGACRCCRAAASMSWRAAVLKAGGK